MCLIDIAFCLFPERLCYVLYVCHKLVTSCRVLAFLYLILFCLHFNFSVSRPGMGWMFSFYFFLFMCGRVKCLQREQCVGSTARLDALCYNCSLSKYLEWWPVALYDAGRSVLMLMKVSKIPRIELKTIHLYQHYSLFVHNKLQYTWCVDYGECARPAQLPVLTEVELCPSRNNIQDTFPTGTVQDKTTRRNESVLFVFVCVFWWPNYKITYYRCFSI
jgi:hypothetical protein